MHFGPLYFFLEKILKFENILLNFRIFYLKKLSKIRGAARRAAENAARGAAQSPPRKNAAPRAAFVARARGARATNRAFCTFLRGAGPRPTLVDGTEIY